MFASDLEKIDKLRTQAVNVQEPHISGVKHIAAYAAQLIWISGKFPIDVGQLYPRLSPGVSPVTKKACVWPDWCGVCMVSSARIQHPET